MVKNELSEDQKIIQSQAAFKQFADQFGENDIIKDIFFEILLEEIYGEPTDNLPLSGTAGQERHKDSQQTRVGEMPLYEIE